MSIDMHTLWPPTYDKFTGRVWSLIVASTFILALTPSVAPSVVARVPEIIPIAFTLPGSYAALWFCDFEPDRYTTTSWAAWYGVNFVYYFLIARSVIGVFKIIKDIRNA